MPSVPTGPSRMACTGSSTWPSTRIAQGRGRITPPKTSRPSESSHSMSSRQQGRTSRSDEKESGQDGPTNSQKPSSPKCDSPVLAPDISCIGRGNLLVRRHSTRRTTVFRCFSTRWACSSAGEHFVHTEGVHSSILCTPTIHLIYL